MKHYWLMPLMILLGLLFVVMVFLQLPSVGIFSGQSWSTINAEIINIFPYLVAFGIAFASLFIVLGRRR